MTEGKARYMDPLGDGLWKQQDISCLISQYEFTWLYTRIYCQKAEGDEILQQMIAPFVRNMREQGLITSFFFIRYFEGGHHLRVRFSGRRADLLNPVRNMLNLHINQYFTQRGFPLLGPQDWGPNGMDDQLWQSRQIMNSVRLVPSYEYDRYEPEVERYGGKQGLLASELHFSHCSDVVLRVLDGENNKTGSHRNAALLLLHALAEAFQLTDQQRAVAFEQQFLSWMSSSWCTPQHHQLFIQEYERHRLTLKRLLPIGQDAPRHKSHTAWTSIIQQWQEALKELYHTLVILEKQQQLTVSLGELISSYIHMLCNRLGIFPREEAFLVYLLYRIYTEELDGRIVQMQTGSAQVR